MAVEIIVVTPLEAVSKFSRVPPSTPRMKALLRVPRGRESVQGITTFLGGLNFLDGDTVFAINFGVKTPVPTDTEDKTRDIV